MVSFRELCGASSTGLYRRGKGDNYAQARYLCYYLQEKGLLVRFYREFRKNCAADRTGYNTLCAVLGRLDMVAWQREWERWVLGLRFP